MTTAAIREQLHHYIDTADDRKIEALYIMLELEIAKMDRGKNDSAIITEKK